MIDKTAKTLDTKTLTGQRNGPYLSFNPVSRTQIWQWCAAMGDNNPLYRDEAYRQSVGLARAVAPPAMMQMWTMRDVNMAFAPGSSNAPPYAVFDVLGAQGYAANVAISYDIQFHRLLEEGDSAHHYTTIHSISPLKQTALGDGYFVVEHAEYLDQQNRLFAEAYITYLQYRPASRSSDSSATQSPEAATASVAANAGEPLPEPEFTDLHHAEISVGQALPELVIPITHKLIVSGAIATQDFIDVHHNAPAAIAAGMPDIFMNILTTCGLTARYLSDWAGPGSRLRRLAFSLQAPNTPGDTLRLNGRVSAVETSEHNPQAEVHFEGTNSRGVHVSGNATLALAG
tara:strand:- start:13 stop:1044 length:1032 start_codon:yes stop_codon:yes gene_type:complete